MVSTHIIVLREYIARYKIGLKGDLENKCASTSLQQRQIIVLQECIASCKFGLKGGLVHPVGTYALTVDFTRFLSLCTINVLL